MSPRTILKARRRILSNVGILREVEPSSPAHPAVDSSANSNLNDDTEVTQESKTNEEDVDTLNENELIACMARHGLADTLGGRRRVTRRNGEDCNFLRSNICKYFHPRIGQKHPEIDIEIEATSLEELKVRHKEEERRMMQRLAERKEREEEERMERELAELLMEEERRREEVEEEAREKLKKVTEKNQERKSETFRLEYLERGEMLKKEREELMEKLKTTEEQIECISRHWAAKNLEVLKENTEREKIVNDESDLIKKKQELRSREKVNSKIAQQKNEMEMLKAKHKELENIVQDTNQ